MIAFLLVAARDPAVRQQWRESLSLEVKNLGNEYETLMYGGMAATQVRPGPFCPWAALYQHSRSLGQVQRFTACYRNRP